MDGCLSFSPSFFFGGRERETIFWSMICEAGVSMHVVVVVFTYLFIFGGWDFAFWLGWVGFRERFSFSLFIGEIGMLVGVGVVVVGGWMRGWVDECS